MKVLSLIAVQDSVQTLSETRTNASHCKRRANQTLFGDKAAEEAERKPTKFTQV